MLQCLFAVSKRGNTTHPAEVGIEEYAASLGMRRFSARSLILSVLLGSHPPRLTVTAIIDFCSLFAIAPGTVRTALSRMVAAGELETDDASYEVTGPLLERQRQQDIGRTAPAGEWDGSWWIAVALADARTMRERRRFRSTMLGAKMGELRPDVWMRPANIGGPRSDHQLMVTRGEPADGTAPGLVGRLWDLDALDQRSCVLLRAVDDTGAPMAHRFIALAATLQYLRTEPQLPEPLTLSRRADELRERYGVAEAGFQRALRHYLGAGDRQ
jgi:phenylacetic acid degradation operon negative regulatory protein